MIRQTLVVLKKNILVMQKTKVVRQSIYIPLVCASLAVLSTQNIPLIDYLQYLWPVYQCVAVNGVVRQTVMELVRARNEKEQENELIMGLRSSSYFLGNWIGCVVLTFLAGAIYIFPAIIGGVYTQIDPFEVLGVYAIFLLALVNQMYCLSSLFQSPMLVGDLCSLINLIVSLMFSKVSFLTASTSKVFLLAIAFFPQAALQFLFYSKNWLARISSIEDQEGAPTDFTYLHTFSLLTLVGEMFGYFIIYIYFNAVIPNEYGTQKKPWFFIMPLINLFRKSPQIQTHNNSLNYSNKNILQNYEKKDQEYDYEEEEQDNLVMFDTSSAVYHEPMNIAGMKQEIQICNLNKAFAGYLAVNNLSLNIYAGQIFCLLGHNGAGKTTTLNLLCGMQAKTSGQVIIHGRDLDTSIDPIRQTIGLCNQQNLLYNMLSVEEHLSYYCDIKGVTGEEKINDIENIIEKCRLQGERTKCASNLSGGNKRKLSLAIALVGKAKTVFLDEPTTGVDSLTREQIWSTLRSIRDEGRVVVLSTHNLDEAECLADRVAIMASGKLLALGTVSYITKQFSTGYQLSIYEKDIETEEQQSNSFDELSAILKKYIPDSKIFRNNHKNNKANNAIILSKGFRALLPITETSQYSELFTALEASNK